MECAEHHDRPKQKGDGGGDFAESHAAVQHAQNKLSYQQADLEGKKGVLKKAE